jgi:hypothetical protein
MNRAVAVAAIVVNIAALVAATVLSFWPSLALPWPLMLFVIVATVIGTAYARHYLWVTS